ncbi:MAG: hypothetical protein CO170_03945 [candidate division SR1 bacterium CG_4_9_14_3_um_filter_40_9]|nr:MAG: hypothetical protein CO170_03945 [candidate division SR1 bacterium CG_4_9_14_3_um_filter_40_9]
MKNTLITKMIHTENQKIKKMNRQVVESIKNNESITQQVLETSMVPQSFSERLADRVASFGGSRYFIVSLFVFMALWIILNVVRLSNSAFDPFPFILLNLILSCLAAVQAPVIMMSQNRKETIDRRRAENDYLINLKAETQIQMLEEKIDLMVTEQMKNLFKLQEAQTTLLKDIKKHVSK